MKKIFLAFIILSSYHSAFAFDIGNRVYDNLKKSIGTISEISEDKKQVLIFDDNEQTQYSQRVKNIYKKVYELDGFKAGDRVQSTYSGKKGIILEMFENKISVIQFDKYSKKCFSKLKHIKKE